MEHIDYWRSKAALWEFFAYSLRYPDEEFVDVVVRGEWAEAARELAAVLELSMLEDFDEEAFSAQAYLSGMNAAESLRILRVESTRLFVGERMPACPPYEGIWRAQDENVTPLLAVNPHSIAVEQFMRRCGLGHPEGTNMPLDHVVSECELMQYLCMIGAGDVAVPDEISEDSLPGESAASAYGIFLDDHIQAWLPRFSEALLSETRHPQYRATATLMLAFLQMEKR